MKNTVPIEPLSKPSYPRWGGGVLCVLCPGSAHILSGQIRRGVCWLLSFYLVFTLVYFVASLPVSGAGWLSIAVGVIYYVVLIAASYRPVRRIGCAGWLLFLVLLCLWGTFVNTLFAASFLKVSIAQTFVISGQSMAPALLAPSKSEEPLFDAAISDRVITSQWIYFIRPPQRGEIVVYRTGEFKENGEPVVWTHRVVGLPGETVDIAPPFVLVNGQKLESPPIFAEAALQKNGGYVRLDDAVESIPLPVTLNEDEYFLLGDNSPRSADSRLHGPVKRKDIIGKVMRIYYPFHRAGLVE